MATPNINPTEARINAGRCKLIRNKRTGNTFERFDGGQGWYHMYERALLHPEEFEIEYEGEKAETVMGIAQYTQGELQKMTVPKLRKIALEYEVTADSKEDLIRVIIEAQAKLKDLK
jgi:hypothetical protein